MGTKSFSYTIFLSVLFISLCSSFSSIAQSQLDHKVFLIGNISKLNPSSDYFQQLILQLNQQQQPTSLLVLGDMSEKNKGDASPVFNTSILSAFDQIKNDNVKIHFISGDKDWDNSGKDGWNHVQQLESYLKKNVKTNNSFSPDDGCPGPHEIKISKNLVIITINSQWFMHPHDRPELTNSTCDILFEYEFWEELEDVIEDNEDKNIIIAAHHPVYSHGFYSGKVYDWKSFIPIFGGPYQSFRRHDGTPKDMSNTQYKLYIQNLQRILGEHHGVIYVSGHEFDTQVLQVDENYFINSGASYRTRKTRPSKQTLFRNSKRAFSVLEFFDDGNVELKVKEEDGNLLFEKKIFCSSCEELTSEDCQNFNLRFNPCQDLKNFAIDSTLIKNLKTQTVSVIPGIQYKAGRFRTKMMGQLYRNEWTTPVTLPYLDIGSYEGGMVPFAKGGGKQTDALKFVLPDGRQFGFRSVNKNVARNTQYILNNTVITDFNQELIANQIPFGDVVTSVLLDHTDIIHMRPRPFVMPDDPRLGPFREEFAGLIGTVEERPKSKKKKRPGFAGADKIISSNAMYRYLFKNNDNEVDRQSVARAFMFDIWVGDWDRHGDNWKWAGYKTGKNYTFKPVPKDRDHVFPIYQGKILRPYLKFTPHTADFVEEINSVYNLMFQGRHLTNFLNSKLNKDDWQEAADYLQSIFNEEIIDEAFEYMPKEIRHFSKERLKTTLLARLKELDKVPQYIEERFSKTGLMIGSNQSELFVAERLQNGAVSIKIFDHKNGVQGPQIFEKTFLPNITKEIHLYGLGGEDQFRINGNTKTAIPIRIIGGNDADEIFDNSQVIEGKKKTLVYDTNKEDKISKSSETIVHRPYYSPQFNVYDFENSFLSGYGSFYFATDEKIGIKGKLEKLNRGFNKPVFKSKFILNFKIIPGLKSFKFKPKFIYNDFYQNQNLRIRGRMAINDTSFDDLYGFGNSYTFSQQLEEDRFYRLRNDNYSFSIGLEKPIFSRSHFRYSLGVEHHDIRIKQDSSFLFINKNLKETALGKNSMIFIRTGFDINLLDNSAMPYDGTRIEIENTLYSGVEGVFDFYGKFDASAIQYFTASIFRPTTLILKLGGSFSYGDAPYYHLTSLGNNRDLKTFNSNQFVGYSGLYFNTMLRYDLGTIGKRFLPFNIGLLGYYDQGRVFFKERFSLENWRFGYGGGAYLTFLEGKIAVNFLAGRNEFEQGFFRLDLGFGIE